MKNTLSNWLRKHRNTHHFIHIPKNGGIAVRNFLQLRGGVSMTDPFHYRYRDLAQTDLNHKIPFCLVRNPWSRTASRYFYARQQCKRWPTDDPRRQYIESVDFSGFVHDRKVVSGLSFPGRPWMGPTFAWNDQLEWILDPNKKSPVLCLRFENLNEDLSEMFAESIKIEAANVTTGKVDYRTLYTDHLAEIILKHHKRDIEHFGFEFDSAATTNTLSSK